MPLPRTVAAFALPLALALATPAIGASAQTPAGPSLPEIQKAARLGQQACVKEGESKEVCACGVGLAYAQLDPNVFVAVPDLEPLLDEKDTLKLIVGVAAVAKARGISIADAQKAAEAIRANRRSVKEVCHALRTAS